MALGPELQRETGYGFSGQLFHHVSCSRKRHESQERLPAFKNWPLLFSIWALQLQTLCGQQALWLHDFLLKPGNQSDARALQLLGAEALQLSASLEALLLSQLYAN